MSADPAILDAGAGRIRSATYLPVEQGTYLWGRLPCATDGPVLTVDSGDEVTVDTLSHEGILEDQAVTRARSWGATGWPGNSCSPTRSRWRHPIIGAISGSVMPERMARTSSLDRSVFAGPGPATCSR